MLHNATYKISIIYIINYIYTYYLSGQVHKTQEKGWLYLYNCNFQILQIFQDICQSIERIEFVPSLFWGATVSTLYNNVFLRSIHHHCASRGLTFCLFDSHHVKKSEDSVHNFAKELDKFRGDRPIDRLVCNAAVPCR